MFLCMRVFVYVCVPTFEMEVLLTTPLLVCMCVCCTVLYWTVVYVCVCVW